MHDASLIRIWRTVDSYCTYNYRFHQLLVHDALGMRPEATSVWDLHLLVCEAAFFGAQSILIVAYLKLLVYEVFSY